MARSCNYNFNLVCVAAGIFFVIYSLIQVRSFRTQNEQVVFEVDSPKSEIQTPPTTSNEREIEFIFPEEGYPADTLKYDFNGQTSLNYLLKILQEETGEAFGNEEFVPWTKYCEQSRYCKPAKEIQKLYKSDIGCAQILPLLEKVRKCIDKRGEKCPMVLNHGFWRDVYAVDYDGQPVVLKSLKAKHVEPRNYLRQIRETIALDAVKEGREWIVPEMGHCKPDENDEDFGYTSMVPRLRIDLEEYLKSDVYEDLTLDHVLSINIMCAMGLEAIHNLPGGPFVHNDLQPRQYLVTDDGRVLLNDLNRGKFLGRHEKTGERCGFCGSKAKGRWRAPEELSRGLLTHKLDIFSLGDVIWASYAWGEDPFAELERKEAMHKIRHGKIPAFTKMTPPEVRQLVRECWSFKADERPEASEVVKRLTDIRRSYMTKTDLHSKRLVTLDFTSKNTRDGDL